MKRRITIKERRVCTDVAKDVAKEIVCAYKKDPCFFNKGTEGVIIVEEKLDKRLEQEGLGDKDYTLDDFDTLIVRTVKEINYRLPSTEIYLRAYKLLLTWECEMKWRFDVQSSPLSKI
jgi:hypothetical protein